MSTLNHINGGFFREAENTLALINVNEIFLLYEDFNWLDILKFSVGLLDSFFHDLLNFELFELIFFLNVLDIRKLHLLDKVESFRNKLLKPL
jgi:hypothetical protein